VGQEAEGDLAVLAMIGAGGESGAEVAFDHAEDRLDLPALAVGFLGESSAHQTTVMAVDWPRSAVFAGPSTFGGRDDAADAQALTAPPVEALGLVAGVAEERPELLPLPGLVEGAFVFDGVGLGATVGDDAQDQVTAGIAEGRKLGITGLFVGLMPLAATGEVVRDVARLQTRGVDGRQAADGRDQAEAASLVDGRVEEPREGVFFRKRRSA